MKKSNRYLSAKEAETIGQKVKENEKGRNKARYFITDEDYDKALNSDLTIIGKSTLRDKDGKVVIEWTKTNKSKEDVLKALRTAVDTLKEEVNPVAKIKKPKKFKNDNLLNQYTLTDYHLGMMSWAEETGSDWDLKIAEETLVRFFEEGISKSPNANECIFAQIGDFLHWDGFPLPLKHLLFDTY